MEKVLVRIILGYFDPQLLQNPAGIFQPDIKAQFQHGSFEAKPVYQILQLLRRITALMCTLKDLPTHHLEVWTPFRFNQLRERPALEFDSFIYPSSDRPYCRNSSSGFVELSYRQIGMDAGVSRKSWSTNVAVYNSVSRPKATFHAALSSDDRR